MTAAPDSRDHAWPPGIRPATSADAEPILAAMLRALERGEYPGLDRHYVEGAAARLAAEPALGAVADDDGRVAGWIVPLFLDLTVDLPHRRRGHATRLLAAGPALAAGTGLPDLRLWVPRRQEPEAFARASGLAYHSSLWRLRLPAGTPVEPPRFAEDVRVRPIEPGPDDEAFVELAVDTFRDLPTPLVLDVATVRRAHARPGFDPATELLVAPAGEPRRLVAFCRITGHLDDDGHPVWEVAHVGVRGDRRGRGLGRELLRWAVTEARRRGAADVLLSVESGNESALRLYESLGFERDHEWPRWAVPTP